MSLWSRPWNFWRRAPFLGAQLRASGLCLVIFICAADFSQAATPMALPSSSADGAPETQARIDLTPEEREQLLARLSDEQVRDLILQIWQQAMPTSEAAGAGTMGGVMADADLFQTNFRATIAAFPELPGLVPLFFSTLIPEGESAFFLLLVLPGLVVVFGVGFGARYLFQRSTAGLRARIAANLGERESTRLPRLIALWLLSLLAAMAFVVGAMAAFLVLHGGHMPVRWLVLTYVAATFAFLAVAATSRFLFAPGDARLRALPIDDAAAQKVHRSFIIVAAYAAFSSATVVLLREYGISAPLSGLLGLINGPIIIGLLIHFVWSNRAVFASVIEPTQVSTSADKIRSAFSRSWHVFYTAAFILLFVVATYSDLTGYQQVTGAAYGTLLILLSLPFVLAAISQCVGTGKSSTAVTPPVGEEQESEVDDGETPSAPPSSAPGYYRLIKRAALMVIVILALITIGDLWGLDLLSMSQTGIGAAIFGGLIEIALALFITYIIWEVVKIAMSPYMPAGGSGGPGDEGGGTGASRITTLMPLLQKFLLITLVTMSFMVVLSALGVNIGPLIAGAGVIGLAIGFGAQALVKDIISGVFFLMDDAFRQGEYIDIGSVKGTVERISIRSLQMRHHNGPVHTVPYGEIQHVTNYSRDWAIMKFELRIPFEVDIDKVRRIIKKTGQAMLDDEEFGPLILEPLKSQGVNRMDDSALIIRCKFTAIPGQQFYVRREAFTRIQRAFEQAGIKFAPKRVLVEATETDKGEEAGKKAANAAAMAAAAVASESVDLPPAAGDDRG